MHLYAANARRVYAGSRRESFGDWKVDDIAEMFDCRRWSAGRLLSSMRLRDTVTERMHSIVVTVSVARSIRNDRRSWAGYSPRGRERRANMMTKIAWRLNWTFVSDNPDLR